MKTLNIVLPAESGLLLNTGGCLVAHSTEETTGSAAAHYRLWDGTTADSTLLMPVSLSADQSTRDYFNAHIVVFRTGLYYELVDGSIEGAVSVRVEHQCDEIESAHIAMILAGYPE